MDEPRDIIEAFGVIGGPVESVRITGAKQKLRILTVHKPGEIASDQAARVEYPDGYTKTHTFFDESELLHKITITLQTRYRVSEFRFDTENVPLEAGYYIHLSGVTFCS